MEPFDVISPELVLVSPELRAAALAGLPERDPDALGARPEPPRHPELDRLRFLVDYAAVDEPRTRLPRRRRRR